MTAQVFSAEDRTGVKEAQGRLLAMLANTNS
jgi:hypothetical protein